VTKQTPWRKGQCRAAAIDCGDPVGIAAALARDRKIEVIAGIRNRVVVRGLRLILRRESPDVLDPDIGQIVDNIGG
jgi:hypothetical protein